MVPRIGVVVGDAAGIGPEIVLKALTQLDAEDLCEPTVFGSAPALSEMVARLALREPRQFVDCDTRKIDSPRWKAASADNGANTLQAIRKAVDAALAGRLDGIVIGPLSKQALHLGGMEEPDEGTLLRNLAGVPWVRLVVRWDRIFRTSVIGHVPFRSIIEQMTTEKIAHAIEVLRETMAQCGVANPRIGVAGINPHAGDGGAFGDEEGRVIEPAIHEAWRRGWEVSGPHPADTVFPKAVRGDFDGVVFMHHDQGNAPMKAAAFGEGAVLYRGLPFPCATVGHGPAYGRAGEGRADPDNLITTLRTTIEWAHNRRSEVLPS